MAPATRDRVKRGKENPPPPKKSDVRISKRVTRSQSQGLDDGDAEQPPPKRPLRRGRQPSVELGDDAKEDSGADNAKRGGGKKRKRQKSPGSELSAVSEEPSRKSPRQDPPASIPETDDGQQLAQDAADEQANISGTTILADSFDASENLDPSLMLEFLPQLLQASTNLLNFLTPPECSEGELSKRICHLRQAQLSTREHLRLSSRISVFETNMNCFGGHKYIDISSVARAFTSNPDDILRQNLNLENVLQKANLAALASNLVRSADSQALTKLLLDISPCFPLPFMRTTTRQASEELTSIEESLLRKTFKLAIDIRTQCLISSPESQKKGDTSLPASYTGEQLIEDHFGEVCRSLLPDGFKEKIRQRTEIIQGSFSKNGETGAALTQLRETFPQEPCISQLANWIRLRMENINQELDQQGNLDDIIEELQVKLDQQDVGKPSGSLQPVQLQQNGSVNGAHLNEEALRGKSPHISDSEISQRTHDWAMLNASSMRVLKQRENKKDQTVGNLEVQDSELNGSHRAASPADSWETCVDSSEPETGQLPPAKANLNVFREKKKQGLSGSVPATKQKRRNLGPAFIDPQEDARKVSPITLEDSARRLKRIKPLPELSDVEESRDDSESESYQRDERRVDIEQNKKRKPNAIVPSKKRRASGKNLPNESGRQHQTTHAKERNNSANANRFSFSSSQSDGSGDNGSRTEERSDYRRAKEEARQLAAAKMEEQNEHKPQTRRKWTEDETQRLIKLVGKVGISWSLIKQQDAAYADRGGEAKLTERTQVQLKDKARNIVMDFYKSGRQLPKNFHKVGISQKQIDKLAELNIEYP